MSNAYSKNYAKMYNINNQNEFSGKLSNKLLNYFEEKYIKINSLLDIACGTGIFCIEMAKYGITDISGFDLSAGMIDEAKKNASRENAKIDFFVGDMTTTNTNRKYDLITCNYDAINHLDGLDKWQKFIVNSYEMVKENGYFLFDFNTFVKYKWFLTLPELIENENSFQNRQIIKKIDENHIEIIDNFVIDGMSEEHSVIESFYSTDEVLNMVRNSGFKITEIFGNDFNKIDNIDNERRLYILCQK